MKKAHLFFMALVGATLCLTSCTRNSDDVWEDAKSAGRHMSRGVNALGGYSGDSRQVCSRADFEGVDDDYAADQGGGYRDCEYVPLDQCDDELAMADMVARQPRETPGEEGSSIPGIEAFRDPSTIPELAGVFKNVYFEYNSSLVKGQDSIQTIHNIADYMRSHPNFYIFVEGHTDERGPQAYNLALGARRSNAVRNMLISEGVNPDNIFTVSYGKERPVILERHEEGWAKNRRAEFKVYSRSR